MNPPIVYELTNPSSHSTRRITNTVQSIGLFLSVKHTYLRTSHFCCAYRDRKFLKFLQRRAQIPVVRLEQTARRFIIALGQLRYDAHCAIAQFRAGGVQIDHEIAADLAESDHRACADDVERNLRRGSRFQSGRPSKDLRSDRQRDYKIGFCSRGW